MTQPPSGDPAAGVPTCYRHAGRETWIRCQRCERPICPDCMRDAAVGFQCPSCIAEGATDDAQHPGAVRRVALGQPGADLDGAHRHQRRGLAGDPGHRPARPACWSTASGCAPTGPARRATASCTTSTAHACDAVGGQFLAGRGRRGLVAGGHQPVHPRAAVAHRGQHARPLRPRPAAGGRLRTGALPGALPALGAGRLGHGPVALAGDRADRRCVRCDLRTLRRPLRRRPQGRRRPAQHRSRCWPSTSSSPSRCPTSPGRATSAVSPAAPPSPPCWSTRPGSAAPSSSGPAWRR